jgi:hypothetical protein
MTETKRKNDDVNIEGDKDSRGPSLGEAGVLREEKGELGMDTSVGGGEQMKSARRAAWLQIALGSPTWSESVSQSGQLRPAMMSVELQLVRLRRGCLASQGYTVATSAWSPADCDCKLWGLLVLSHGAGDFSSYPSMVCKGPP